MRDSPTCDADGELFSSEEFLFVDWVLLEFVLELEEELPEILFKILFTPDEISDAPDSEPCEFTEPVFDILKPTQSPSYESNTLDIVLATLIPVNFATPEISVFNFLASNMTSKLFPDF